MILVFTIIMLALVWAILKRLPNNAEGALLFWVVLAIGVVVWVKIGSLFI